jgi:hypothetical protein
MRLVRISAIVILLIALFLSAAAPAFAVDAAQLEPVIDAIIPATGFRGIPVAIQGSRFGALQTPLLSTVTFNGVDAGQALIWSDNYIVVVVPQQATTGPVVVTTIFGASNSFQLTIYEQPTVYSSYFAEGTTRAGFEEWLTLYNPWDTQNVATVTYLIANGANRIRYYNIPAHSRTNIYVNSEIGSDMDVSVSVSSTAKIYVERPMYFRYKNMWSGGHDTVPALKTGQTWYFAEGTTRAGFEEWLCLGNPSAVDAQVNVTYIFETGDVVTLPYTVPAWKRYTVDVNATVGAERDVAVKVDSSQPIVAERPMYFNYRYMWDDGHIAMGAPSPEKTWYFAEGTTRAGFEEWLCLGNPSAEDAAVHLTYHMATGGEVGQDIMVPAGRRRTVYVNEVIGPDLDVAVKVDSSQPIVAERPMYFNYRSIWNGGHITMGAPATATAWFFAEGTTRAGFEEWLCLLNPGDTEATVVLKYAFQDGGTQDQNLVLAPGQRSSIFVNEVVGQDKDVAVRVESDQGIVAERSMYFSYHGVWDGGSNTIGCVDQ